MNNKSKFITEERKPEYKHEIVVNGHTLKTGMQATLASRTARGNSRRFEFRYAEDYTGTLFLVFYGPLRSTRQRFRVVRAGEVEKVHVKTKHIAEELADEM